jgi:GNAT superfamily N-acetyltransferase
VDVCNRLVTLGVEDAGEVLTLQRAAYVTEAQAHSDVDLLPLRQTLAELTAELFDSQVLAVGWRSGEGRLVAAGRARVPLDAPNVAHVGRLTVVPDRQGQGLGTSLLGAIEAGLPASVTELRLFTGERSADNLRLYERFGYVETAREPTPAGYALVHLRKPRPGPVGG